MVKISDCFYNVINLLCFVMKLAGMICKLDRFLENWQIVQCNLQIGWPINQLADWPGQFVNWADWTGHVHQYLYCDCALLHYNAVQACVIFFQRSAKHRMKHT